MRPIALILAALAAPAIACPETPPSSVLEDAMRQATWTTETGRYNARYAFVSISLPALPECLTWSVDLVLRHDFGVNPDSDGNPGASSHADLASDAAATFWVSLPQTYLRYEYVRGWLRVKVRNPIDDAGAVIVRANGSLMWLYPVRFKAQRPS